VSCLDKKEQREEEVESEKDQIDTRVNVQKKSSVSETEKTTDTKDKCSKPRGANETIPVHKPSWRTCHSGKVPHRRGKQGNLKRREGESDRTHDDDNEDVHSVGCDRTDIPDQILGYQRHQPDEIVDRYEKDKGPQGRKSVCAVDLNSLVDNGAANCENQDANEDDKMAHVGVVIMARSWGVSSKRVLCTVSALRNNSYPKISNTCQKFENFFSYANRISRTSNS
jgi:hypothetical protein